jgi:hypothetical protein
MDGDFHIRFEIGRSWFSRLELCGQRSFRFVTKRAFPFVFELVNQFAEQSGHWRIQDRLQGLLKSDALGLTFGHLNEGTLQ